jgi:hypothetical protein
MKKILFAILAWCPIAIFASTNNDSLYQILNERLVSQSEIIENQSRLLDSLNREFHFLKRNSEFSIDVNEKTLNSISNQIGFASYSLTIFGILFGIAVIGLGIYVTYVERKVVKLNIEGMEQLAQSEKIKNEVSHLNDLIQKDIFGLYEKIKYEETNHILKRLVKVPKDIGNLSETLLSRELNHSEFPILKEAYLKLRAEVGGETAGFLGMSYIDKYHLLFFQHFLGLAIKDDEIGPNMTNFYELGIGCAFENDILKSTEDFIKSIVDVGFQNKSQDISNYFLSIAKSPFVDLTKLYEILFNGIINRDNHFNLFNQIPDTEECEKIKVQYGNLLIKSYSSTEISPSEQAIFDNISELKTKEDT